MYDRVSAARPVDRAFLPERLFPDFFEDLRFDRVSLRRLARFGMVIHMCVPFFYGVVWSKHSTDPLGRRGRRDVETITRVSTCRGHFSFVPQPHQRHH